MTRKQEQAIACLLTASSIAEAAAQAGVNQRTLFRWLKDATFQAAYCTARRQVVQHAMGQVQQAANEAVTSLRTIMLDDTAPASARVSAAKMVLDLGIKTVEIENLEARLAALEARWAGV